MLNTKHGLQSADIRWRIKSVMNKLEVISSFSSAARAGWRGLMLCGLLLGTLNTSAASAPVITSQPTNQAVLLGSSATFSVVALTGTPLFYQWYYNSVLVKGATNNTYVVLKAQYTNAGSYYVNVINTGGTAKSAVAKLNINPPAGSSLPAPWVSTDIGAVGLIGSAYSVSNNYTVNGAGASLVGATPDQFHFVYQTINGDGSLTARVTSQSGTNVNGYVGIMMRETTATGSRFMFAARQGSGIIVARSRASTGGATTSTNGPTRTLPNCWLQLSRTGNNIAALTSTNGSAWVSLQTNAITMATNVIFGLFVTSGSTNVLDSDTFTNLTVIP